MTDDQKTRAQLIQELRQLRARVAEEASAPEIPGPEQAQEALKSAETRYRQLFEGSRDGFVFVSPQGRILDANRAYSDMLGYTLDELRAMRDFFEITPKRWHQWEKEEIWERRLFEMGYSGIYEKEYIRKDGETFPVELQSYAVFGLDGSPEYLWGVARDITERKQAEEALRERATALARTQRIAHVGSWTLDLRTDRLTWSDEVYRIFGLEPQEFTATYEAFLEAVHPEDRAAVDAAYWNSVQEGKDGYEIEHRIVRENRDEVRHVRERCVHERDAGGLVVRSIGMVQDITERKVAERAIKRQLDELSVLHSVASACAQATDEDELITELTDLLHRELLPEDLGLFMMDAEAGGLRPHPSYRISAGEPQALIPISEGVIGQVGGSGLPRRVGDVRTEPSYIRASPITRSELAVPVKVGDRVIAVINAESRQIDYFTDEDERLLSTVAGQVAPALERLRLDRETRRRLAELEALHRASCEIMAAGPDAERVYTSVYRIVAELMPCEAFVITLHDPAKDENEAVFMVDAGGRSPPVRFPADEGLSGYVISRGTGVRIDDYAQQSAISAVHFGSPKPVRSVLAAPLQMGRRVVGMLSAQTYLPHAYTEQDLRLLETLANHVAAGLESIRLFQQIQAQARRVQAIVDSVPEGVLLVDTEQRVLLANPVAEDHLALLTDAGASDTVTQLGDRPLSEFLTSPPKGLWHEAQIDERTFEIIARPIEEGSDPEQWVLVINDATEERAVRQQLEMQERLAMVGELAAGIAHDFNNILASISLYAQLSLRGSALTSQLEERMRVILAEANSGARLVQQVLDFSRQGVIERQPVALVPLLKEQMKLLERTLPEHVEIELVCSDTEHTIYADHARVQQVVMNLALNARDAMPEGGKLRITVRHVTDGAQVHCTTCGRVSEGTWVEVAMTDTGCGIPAEVLPRIFEPFFTTRAPLGHGLGLAQVYGIVKQHDGHLDVETEVGAGTTFRLYWPALSGKKAAPVETHGSLSMGHSETVLVVEDNETVRGALADVLRGLGYEVLVAENGEDALDLLESERERIRVVLSDWVMPVMGGLTLAEEMSTRFPETGVVMLTGHSRNEATRGPAPDNVIGWLQKPPDLGELAAMLQRALADRSAL